MCVIESVCIVRTGEGSACMSRLRQREVERY